MSFLLCPKCGFRASAVILKVSGLDPVKMTFVLGCPCCGTEMFPDDPLGQIERDSREPLNLRDIVGTQEGLRFLDEDDAA